MNLRFRIILAAIVPLLVWGVMAEASTPVWVSVEIGSPEGMDIWKNTGGVTCQIVGGTAIGWVDDTAVARLQKRGLKTKVIALYKAGTELYLVPRTALDATGMQAMPLWEKYGQCLVSVPVGENIDGRLLASGAVRISNNPLPSPISSTIGFKFESGPAIQWDSNIQDLVDQVNIDSIMADIRRMEAFRTRMCLSDSSRACSDWLHQRFDDLGVANEFDSVYVSGSQWGAWPGAGWERSVVAHTPGSMVPDREIIICGHFDSFRYPDTQAVWTYAPGADDNATGVAVAIEAARIFRSQVWEPNVTYAAWTGEEIGFWGSRNYAERSYEQQKNITAVINLDMVGYIPDTFYSCNAGRIDDRSLFLSELVSQITQLYVPGLPITQPVTGAGSDHFPFAYVGYPAIELAERETAYGNPHWHQASDTAGIIDQNYLLLTAKAAVAVMAVLGKHPGVIDSVAATDIGDGQSALVSWTASPYTDVVGYWLHWELLSQMGADSIYLSGRTTTSSIINGLFSDSTYLFGVTAVDAEGHLGIMAAEITFVPRIAPLAPQGVTVAPITRGIEIRWKNNTELDLQGYRLYRAANDTLIFDSLNTTLLCDTCYVDSPLSGANRYYYKVRALDNDGNEGPLSDLVYCRPVTLDQGILVVDETFNATVGTMPRDTSQDKFYGYILSDYKYDQHEYGTTQEKPALCDLAPYSTVLWHGDDYSNLMASGSVNDLRQYLDWGGNLWLVGWKPASNIENNTNYPKTFSDTCFAGAYLKLAGASISASADSFMSASGLLGYPDIQVDPAKVPITSWGGTMRYIEGLILADSGEAIYAIDMRNNSSLFDGLPCGVRFDGPYYKTVYFSFPLYFMDKDQSKAAVAAVMTWFGEPSGAAGLPEKPAPGGSVWLEQNGPNPFNSSTKISFYIPKSEYVSLKIYNIAGQRVRTLAQGKHAAGVHYLKWDGRGDNGIKLPCGIYLCGLETDSRTVRRKMIMIQ